MSPETADGYVYVSDDPEAANDILQHAPEEGVDAGRLAALRHAVLAVLAARGVAVPNDARARVEAVADVATLDRWLVAAATAATAADALR